MSKSKKVKTRKSAMTADEGSAPGIETYDYATTKAEIRKAANRITQLQEHQARLEADYDAGLHWKEAAQQPITSDEGISCARLSAHRVVNLATDSSDAKRAALHLNGQPYCHVHDTPDGEWIYRLDK